MKVSEINLAITDLDDVLKSPDEKLRELVSGGMDALSGVPVFSLLSTASDFLGRWANRRFAERLYKFMVGISAISEEDRFIFFSDLEECEEKRRTAAEIIMSIISKLDSEWKVDVLVNLFESKVKGFIKSDVFIRLSYSIQYLSLSDINTLKTHRKGVYLGGSSDALLSAGLLQPYSIGQGSTYVVNSNGRALLAHGLLERK